MSAWRQIDSFTIAEFSYIVCGFYGMLLLPDSTVLASYIEKKENHLELARRHVRTSQRESEGAFCFSTDLA